MRTEGNWLGRVARPSGWQLWHNFPQKLGALIAAVALWFAASSDRQVVVERTFEVPLLVRGEGEALKASDYPRTIRVTLSGDRDRLDELTPRLVEVSVNVAGLGDGPVTVPVTVNPPADTRVARVEPREVSLRLDAVVSEPVPVRVAVTGLPGDAIVQVSATPSSALATGPRTRVSTVVHALAVAPRDAAAARLIPVDENGQPVDGVTLRPASVRLERSEVGALVQKTVPIHLADPLAGLGYRSVNLRPARVTVVGPPADLAALEGITARPVGQLTPGTHTLPLRLELPAGVRSLEPAGPTVTLTVVAPTPRP